MALYPLTYPSGQLHGPDDVPGQKGWEMKNVIRVLGRKGDEVVATWDPASPVETEQAQDVFNNLMGGGYLMFTAVDTSVPEQIRHFPKTAQEIIAVPRFVGG